MRRARCAHKPAGESGSTRCRDGGEHGSGSKSVKATFASVILQIMLVYLVFSLDSIITAVGDNHVPKGNVYFGMAFSLAVEMLNIRMRKKGARTVQLNPPHIPGD